MTKTQRDALTDMMRAILAVDHCPADIRFRAESLMDRLTPDPLKGLFGSMGRPS